MLMKPAWLEGLRILVNFIFLSSKKKCKRKLLL